MQFNLPTEDLFSYQAADHGHVPLHLGRKSSQLVFLNEIELGADFIQSRFGIPARRFPDRNFIGIDIKGNRLWKGAKTALDDKLGNVAFLRTRIDYIDKAFGPDEVEEIWITFPDPQKEKAKKRLTHPMFLARYRKFLKPGAVIHLKTDNELLFEYTLGVISKENHVLLDSTNDLYENKQGSEEAGETQTFYEKIYLKAGKKIKYLKFRID